jgi:hypothetical protein
MDRSQTFVDFVYGFFMALARGLPGASGSEFAGDLSCVLQRRPYMDLTGILTTSSLCITSLTTNPSAYSTPTMRP